jgi:hypothetical protein
LLYGAITGLDAAGEEKVMDQHQGEAMGSYLFLLFQETRGCDHLSKRGLV